MNEVKLSIYGILINEEGKVLLQKRANTQFASGWWSLPGGHIESEESTLNAIRRELAEECGIDVNPVSCSIRLTLVRKHDQGKRYVNFFCLVNEWEGTPLITDGKASELLFFSKEELPEQILPYIQEALELIESGVHFYETDH